MLSISKILIIPTLLLPAFCFGQKAISNTPLLDSAIQNTRSVYSQAFVASSHLLNGVEYKDYDFHNYDVGHPYFMVDDWELGSINYDGQLFENVDMLYNTMRDKVIIDHPQGHFKLELIDEKVSSFSFLGHHFVKLLKDTSNNIRPGYYDLLYDGKVKVYAKQRKTLLETLNSRAIVREFIEGPVYYIYKDGKYNIVRSKSAILKVFLERKVMLRKHLAKLNIRYKYAPTLMLIESAKFFDESGK